MTTKEKSVMSILIFLIIAGGVLGYMLNIANEHKCSTVQIKDK